MTFLRRLTPLALLFSGACSDVEDTDDDHGHDHDHNHGLTTKLVANFAPATGGSTLTFAWSDPEDDGSPIIDAIELPAAGEIYTVTLEVWNELEDPAEEVTPEIAELDTEHQFFFTGSAVHGPANDNPDAVLEHSYLDEDADGLPLGIDNQIITLAAGTGDLIVTLRHLPPENGSATKTPGLADDVAGGGLSSIAGDNDISVVFPVEVL